MQHSKLRLYERISPIDQQLAGFPSWFVLRQVGAVVLAMLLGTPRSNSVDTLLAGLRHRQEHVTGNVVN